MKCAVIGKRYIWIFFAPNKIVARRRANDILFSEDSGLFCINKMSIIDFTSGYWEAVGEKLEEIKNLRLKRGGEVIEIKRKKPPKIDAIYMTRRQREREK